MDLGQFNSYWSDIWTWSSDFCETCEEVKCPAGSLEFLLKAHEAKVTLAVQGSSVSPSNYLEGKMMQNTAKE